MIKSITKYFTRQGSVNKNSLFNFNIPVYRDSSNIYRYFSSKNTSKIESTQKFDLFKMFKHKEGLKKAKSEEGKEAEKTNTFTSSASPKGIPNVLKKSPSFSQTTAKFKMGMLVDIVDTKQVKEGKDSKEGKEGKEKQPDDKRLIKPFTLFKTESPKASSSEDVITLNTPSTYSSPAPVMKPIFLRKHVADANDHFREEDEHNLRSVSPRLPKDISRKWERFFKRNSKPLLDLNRAINNKPDRTYLEFFHDMKESLNEEQFLFAIKNMALNKEKDLVFSWNDTIIPLFNNIMKQKRIQLTSKNNIITLFEVLHFLNLNTVTKAERFSSMLIETSIDYIRLFAETYIIEEYLLILEVLLNENNFYDAFLVEFFFTRFNSKDFDAVLSNSKTYKVKYFQNEIKMGKTVLLVIENYVHFIKSTNGTFKQAKIIENILNNLIKNLHEDSISIKDLMGVKININNITSIFPFEISLVWERALNAVILQKLNSELSKEDVDSIKLEDFSNYAVWLNSVKNTGENNLFSQELFEDIYHKLCYLFNSKLESMDYHNVLFYKNEQNWMLDYMEIKDIFMCVINYLMETSIEHRLFDRNLVEPFLVFLYYELTRGVKSQSAKSEVFRSNLLTHFGKYNFDQILKKEEFSQISLDCYFKILSAIEKHTIDSFQFINTKLKEIKTYNMDFESKISEGDGVMNSLKEFYTRICDIEETDKPLRETLQYEKEKSLSQNSNYFLLRLKSIPKKYQLFTYMNTDFAFHPLDNIHSSKQAFNILLQVESFLDCMITLINSKVVKVAHCELFIKFLNEIISPYENAGENISNSSLYNSVVRPALMSNKSFYTKFSLVLNFLFFPQNYYNIYETDKKSSEVSNDSSERVSEKIIFTHEKLQKIISDKYNLEQYKVWTHNELTKTHFNTNSFYDKSLFKNSLNGLVRNDKESIGELEDFVDNYYIRSDDLITKMLDDNRYEISHQHFMNKVNKEGSLYYAPEQMNLYNFNINELQAQVSKGEEKAIAKEHLLLYKILIDLAKIAQVIDRSVVKTESITDCVREVDRFYSKRGEEKREMTDITDNIYVGSLRNLSDLTSKEILESHLNYEYLKSYVHEIIEKENKKFDLKKYKLEKVMECFVKYYPLFPYAALYAFSNNDSENLNWLILLNSKYRNTDVITSSFENQISYLKSQYDNILIFD